MCGIAGVIGSNAGFEASVQLAQRMAWQLRHRGPDGAGFFHDPGVLLVHTRLSIIDLASGAQPIHNEDKTVWVIFNGEIFNFIELRQQLVALGHRFYTSSDTEVIVHLYEEYGLDFPSHLNGQFAIALWDTHQQTCVLVRDRIGIAPLYYTLQDGVLAFGSEIKAVLEQHGQPSFDFFALNNIFTFWTTLEDQTPFEGINALAPGHMAVFRSGQLQLSPYWSIQFPAPGGFSGLDPEPICEQVDALLTDATRIRMRSDVPVGAYLSGGLDSSILTALMHQLENKELSTFSISFADEGHDESAYQKIMIEFLRARHQNVFCANSDIGNDFLDAMWHIEFPMIRTAPIPMSFLSGLARRNNYKVVLTGEGADEFFGGYDLFKETKIRQFWAKNPDSNLRSALLNKLYPYLNLGKSGTGAFVRKFFAAGLEDCHQPLFSHLTRINSASRIKALYSHQFDDDFKAQGVAQLVASLPANYDDWHWFNKAQYLEIKTLMAAYLLTSQGDRMLMRNSVEGRFPFLDHRVIELSSTIDPRLKMKGLTEKYILRKAMGRYLPQGISSRVKQPYRAPNAPSFFDAQRPAYLDELMDERMIRDSELFDVNKVNLLFRKAQSVREVSNADNMAVVAVLSTLASYKHFIRDYGRNFGRPVPGSATPLQRMS